MNRKKIAGSILSIFLTLGACTTARVSYAIMTTDVDEQGKPIDEVLSYKSDAAKFVCVADIRNAPPDSKITMVWVYRPKDIEIDRVEVVLPGSKSVNSTLTRGENPWPLGQYVVRIFIDQQKEPADLVPFLVKE